MGDNDYESLGIDERGMLKLFEDGLSHTDFTLLMEGVDNMVKALRKIISNEPFHIHENEYQKVFYDFGCGMNKLRENLKGGLRSDDNDNCLSKCGIGLNTMIAKYLKDYGYFFIITAFKDDGDVDYDGVFMIREDDLIKRMNIKVESRKFRPYVEDGLFKDGKTGTFMFTDKRKKEDYKEKENDIALNDLKNFLENNCLEVSLQFRKDSKLVPGGPNKLKYEDAGIHYKLSRILEGCEIDCYYNNDKVNVSKYITEKDTKIFDHTLYIKRNPDNDYPIIAFLNTNVFIRAGKTTNKCQFNEVNPNITMSEQYMEHNEYKKLGKYTAYLHEGKILAPSEENTKDLLKNQYIINGIRTVGFGKMCTNEFVNCRSVKGKMEIELSYMKQFLNGKKTDEHFYDMQMDKDLKRINNILTKSLIFEPLLNRNGYTFSSNHLTSAGTKAKYKAFITKKAHDDFEEPVELEEDSLSEEEDPDPEPPEPPQPEPPQPEPPQPAPPEEPPQPEPPQPEPPQPEPPQSAPAPPESSRHIPDKLKQEIWIRAFGDKFYGNCFCCNRQIQVNWNSNNTGETQFGHIVPWTTCHKNEWTNIVPICKGCNGAMGNTNMDVWVTKHYPKNLEEYKERCKKYLESKY
tara:strand:- start:1052 stop:2941 length:1890 start_codon:yes stop_codon:yes gene_type:complete